MALKIKPLWQLLKTAAADWVDDKAPRLGAALSYYTVFAIPPLFVIILFLVGLVMDPQTVRSHMFSEVGGLIGEQSAKTIESAMEAQYNENKGAIASILAVVMLLVTSTGFFVELQSAMNTVWGVEAKSGQGIMGFVRNRLLSFAMVIGIGFLLLVSLVISAALSAFGEYLNNRVPGMDTLWMIVNALVSFAVITLLFAMIFKVLPDVQIAWRDVWIGAIVTAVLFTIGKFALGFYLGKNTVVSAYGAAGSLVIILLWVYYSAQILFFGAEVTQVYANEYGKQLQPSQHAQWIAPSEPKQARQSRAKAARKTDLDSQLQPARQRRLVADLKREVESLRELVGRS